MEAEGFSLMGERDAKILILGSMPSVKSIEQQQYYAHPQNVFWRIMSALFEQEYLLEYEQRKALLTDHHIALWDVLKFCERQGSLDASIKKETMEINDFGRLLTEYSKITHVFFNGSMAESVYIKSVLPLMLKQHPSLVYFKMPSTSPAYAAMKFEDKLMAWSVIKDALEGNTNPNK